MKSVISSINSRYMIARSLPVLSLINTGERLNSCGLPHRKDILCTNRIPRLRFPYAWLGVLCCLFMVQGWAAGETDSPSLESDFFELEYKFSQEWRISFAPQRIGGGKFSITSLYHNIKHNAYSDSYDDSVGLYDSRPYPLSLYEGWGANVARTFKVTDRFSSQIYLGAYHWQEERLNFLGANKDVSSRGISPYGGGGIKYHFSDKVNILLDWNHFEIQGESYDQLGLKFQFRF